MNIVKLNARNQLSIPKEVMEKITFGEERVAKVIATDQNQIVIIPISPEPILPQLALDGFVHDTIQSTKNSKNYLSVDAMFHDLDRPSKRK